MSEKQRCQFGALSDDAAQCGETATCKWGDFWFCDKHGRRDKTAPPLETGGMTPEEQREALAADFPKVIGLSSSGAWMWRDRNANWYCCYPENDPLTDLNAMAEVFRSLGLVEQFEWHSHLFRIVRRRCADNLDDESVRLVAANAHAAERAEAVCRVKHLDRFK